ncbi:hypothetical protein JGH11_10965 [Dysgonomonas sp. Marseille-P4677]|uniref:hypothetical protein n=1 Tax=Dysgonomonas sp. Marseille-P4677 TaxID=2364790 RepID=UPI00191499F1|nr:hypothetical protein [Dysgonomonas sp. Marseille-P4677]MBK5721394.1 hypothetical protein [Dysgonomonas sp. Marseille-P4677]
MAYEIKNGQGTAFKNDKYENGGNQPYARGKFKTPDGKEYDITLWIPKSDKVKVFNLTIQEPYQGVQGSTTQVSQNTPQGEGDNLPF